MLDIDTTTFIRLYSGMYIVGTCSFDRMNVDVYSRSSRMEIQVHSPTVKVVRSRGHEPAKSLPVFGDQDRIEGVVRLDPHLYVTPGQLVVTVSFPETEHNSA